MQRTVFAIALCALLAAGCNSTGRFIQRGIDQYERDNYRGALHEWDDLNGAEGSMNDKGLVRYLVYRGLTHYRLGQRSYAIVFLQRGKTAYERGNASWLKPRTVIEMNEALADLQQNPRGTAPAASAAPDGAAPPPAAPASAPSSAPSAAPSAAPAAASTGEALVPLKKTGSAPSPKPSAAPAKTSSPPTRTAPAVQSTSPK